MHRLRQFARQSITTALLFVITFASPALVSADPLSAATPTNAQTSAQATPQTSSITDGVTAPPVVTPTPTPVATPTPTPSPNPSASPTPSPTPTTATLPTVVAPSSATTTATTIPSSSGSDSAASSEIIKTSEATFTDAQQNSPDGGTNLVKTTTSGGTNLNLNTAVTIGANIDGNAQSGNALQQDNKKAGDATTGNATAAATVVNLLQSSASLSGSGFTTFTKNIPAGTTGDVVIDPSSFMQPAATGSANLNGTNANDLVVNSQLNGTIQNNINLNALSGNALQDGNTHAGNATTGDANAVANVMNMINSVVAANQSFVGTINIYGDYSGNIILPTGSLQSLLAANGLTTGASEPGNTTLATDSSQSIANNLTLSAISGSATQTGNKKSGNVTTGNALTKLTILNLTGHQVTAANSLLVFVNVLGSWVGVIMDAPAGSTSAALTGDDASSGNAADGTAADGVATPDQSLGMPPGPSDASFQLSDTTKIINNVTVHAQSGDATESGNKKAGNATSGKATASASIANIMNSSFSLSHWFGVLFINVFGSWHGSVAMAKPAATTAATNTNEGSASASPQLQPVGIYNLAHGGTSGASNLSAVSPSNFATPADYDQFVASVGKVLAANDVVKKVASSQQSATPAIAHQKSMSLSVLPIALGVTGLTFVGAERIKSVRRKLVQASRKIGRS